tara:strand:- start:22349 stop:23203 length:855 start_codon:yes stop_codon:yes gene_type:complete
MSAQILDGKAIAAGIRNTVKGGVEKLTQAGHRAPSLVVILVGNNAASEVYVKNKEKACKSVGFKSSIMKLPIDTSQNELFSIIDNLNSQNDVDGILVQLPLPEQIDENLVNERIDPKKDVDGFHPFNIGRLVLRKPILRPCTPKGIMTMLEHTNIDLVGKDAVIIGQSNIVGRPMLLELLMARCTPTICHSKTKNLKEKMKSADIIIAAVGVPKFIMGADLKEGCIAIDVGINKIKNNGLCGDIDFESAKEVAEWISPVPGGVGPMTVATLLSNTMQAATLKQN